METLHCNPILNSVLLPGPCRSPEQERSRKLTKNVVMSCIITRLFQLSTCVQVAPSVNKNHILFFSAISYASPKPEEWMNWTWWCKIQQHVNSVCMFEFVCVCLSLCFSVCVWMCLWCGWVPLSFFFVKVCVSISLSLSVCVFESLCFFVSGGCLSLTVL